MISEWKLFNFKSVADETRLAFRPLTLFAGPNSSGKSTCIQSILLVCQTLRNPIGSRPIILNGALARLGQFSDLKTIGSVANEIGVGWGLLPARVDRGSGSDVGLRLDPDFDLRFADTEPTSIDCEISFDAKLDVQNDPTQLNPQLFSFLLRGKTRDLQKLDQSFSLGFSRAPDAGESKLMRLKTLKASNEDSEWLRAAVMFDVETDDESLRVLQKWEQDVVGEVFGAEIVGGDLLHFIPNKIAVLYNRSERRVRAAARAIFDFGHAPIHQAPAKEDLTVSSACMRILQDAIEPLRKQLDAKSAFATIVAAEGSVSLHDLLISMFTLPGWQKRKVIEHLQSDRSNADKFVRQMRSELEDEYGMGVSSLPPMLRISCNYIRRYFVESVRYLGPLRDEPKALYPLAGGADPMDVGLKGENTAAVLDVHKNRLIKLIPPAAFAESAITAEPIFRTLKTAVSEWLKYLGVADNVESIDRGKLGHELKIRIDERSGDQDLTHVGVGVSQVLPILVMCLLADPDTVLLFEQPELHLHPKVQTLLGDFFLSMALLRKQCIIETHSEYLINRLRFRAAAADSNNVSNQMTIYFVEKKEGKSQFRPIEVNEFGAIQDWPEGFFDQSQHEAEETLKAAVKKKRYQTQARKL